METDAHEIERVITALETSRDELSEMTNLVGKARQINSWDSERRRAALSKSVAPLLPNMGVAAAEHTARASKEYVEAMRLLQKDLYEAEKVLAEYDACKTRFEAARSILSVQKSMMQNI